MKKKILIAEDDQISCEYLRELFVKEEGFDIVLAKNGKEAVEICKKDPDITLVLMDIKMPQLNGEKATKIIKDHRPELPVIAQTAYALGEERMAILDSGFDDYLAKPIKKEDLFTVIEKHLSVAEKTENK
ncbi:MAG: response regulator [Fidelibacterota bacterium]